MFKLIVLPIIADGFMLFLKAFLEKPIFEQHQVLLCEKCKILKENLYLTENLLSKNEMWQIITIKRVTHVQKNFRFEL